MSWHNQLVLLTGAFQQLGNIVGGVLVNAFKPFIQALNSVMDAVINFAQVVSDALGAIFGWEYQVGGGAAQEYEAAAGAASDLEDATGGAAKKAKELNRYIAAWHEVNNMTTSDSGSGGGSGGGGGAGGAGGAADGGEWIQKESLWEKYTSSIDTLYELGDYIGGVLTDAMNDIDWDSVYQGARNFGTGLASFLNGLISPELFGALGRTIAGALNTVIYAQLSFGQTFDWTNLGESIAAGINNFFATFDFAASAETFNTFALGILDAIIAAIDKTDWDMIGSQIGTYLEGIDFIAIGKKVGKALWKAINAGFDIYKGMFSAAPLETSLLSILTVVKNLKQIKSITKVIGDLGTKAKSAAKLVETLARALTGNQSAVLLLSQNYPKLSSALQTTLTGFNKLQNAFKQGKGFSTLNEMITNLRNNLTGFQKIGITLGSAFAEFNMVNDAVSNLATGTGNVAANLAELAGGAAIGAAGMYAALGPAGLAMAAVTGVIAALKGIDEAMKEKSGYNDLVERLDALSAQADEVNRKSESIKKNLEGMRESFETTGEAQAAVAESLANKYDTLHSKANPTAGDIALMKQYSKELVDMYPELEQFFNNETGLLETNKGAIQDVIDKNKELAISNAALSGMEEAYKEQIKASKNLAEAKSNEAAAQEELNNAQRELQEYLEEHPFNEALGKYEGDFFGQGYIAANDKIEAATKSWNEMKEATKQAQDAYNDAADTVKYFGDVYDESIKATVAPSEELIGQFESIGLSFEKSVLSKIESSGSGDAITTLFTNMKNGVAVGQEELAGAFEQLGYELPSAFAAAISAEGNSDIQSQLTQMFVNLAGGVPQSSDTLKQAFEQLGLDLPDSLLDGLESQNAIVQSSVITLIGQIESGVSLKQPELDELFTGLGINLPNSLVEALSGQNNVVQQNTIELLSQIESGEGAKKDTLLNLFNSLGIEVSDELITSMQDKNDEVFNQAIELLLQLPNATDKERDGIIKKLNNLGIDASGGYNSGLQSNIKNISTTAQTMVSETKKPVEDEFNSTTSGAMYDAGANASKGFWQGLKDWWDDSWLGRKLAELNNAITGKKGLDEHSPSRKWYGFAALGVEGFNNGLTDGFKETFPLVQTELGNLSSGIKKYQMPVVDIMPNIDQYKFKPTKINAAEVTGKVQEALEYAISAGGLIDYNRLGQAVYEAQSQVAKENPLKIGDRDVFDANTRETIKFGKRTGKMPYPVY